MLRVDLEDPLEPLGPAQPVAMRKPGNTKTHQACICTALFNLGIDRTLRGCDLVDLKVRDVCHGDQVATRAIVVQHRTQRPVQFEISQAAVDAVHVWAKLVGLKSEDCLFPNSIDSSLHSGPRQRARILAHWVDELGLDRTADGTHSMRRTKAKLIYPSTQNLRAVPLLIGHSKIGVVGEVPRHRS